MADVINPGSMPAARRTGDEFRRGIITGAIAGLVGGGVLGAIIGASMSDGREGDRTVEMGAGNRTDDRIYGTDRPVDLVPNEAVPVEPRRND